MGCIINRRNFLYSFPFILNANFKRFIIVEITDVNKKSMLAIDETKIEEIPFKIINKYPNAFVIEIKYSENEKYLFKKIFWQVPLLEDFNLWTKQKWIINKKIYDNEKIELILCGF